MPTIKTTILLAALLIPLKALATLHFTIDTTHPQQTIDCFGASDAWSMRYMGTLSPQLRQDVARLLFSQDTDADGNPQGIALSLWRFNIGAGSAEQGKQSQINRGTRTECLINPDGTFNPNKQKEERRFLQTAKSYGVPYILGFLNSPPVYYTANTLATNTGRGSTYNLQEDKYAALAKYITTIVKGIEHHDGVKINYISPVNEPDGHWNWTGPKQEGTPATKYEIARLARELDKVLTNEQISGTSILIPESSDYRCMMNTHMTPADRGYLIQSFFSPDSTTTYLGTLKHLPRLMAAHSYWTNTPVAYMKQCREELRDTLAKYGVEYWQTETCIMGNDEEIGGGGGYDRTMKTALYVARIIHHDLVYANARSWQWWRAIGGDYKDGLLFRYKPTPTHHTDTIVDSKLLWTLGAYSRFIRPGAQRLSMTKTGNPNPDSATDPYGIMCSAYRNTDGTTVIVAINYSNESQKISLDTMPSATWNAYRTSDQNDESLKKVISHKKLKNIKLPPRSVTTFTTKP